MKLFIGASSSEKIPEKYVEDCTKLLEVLLKECYRRLPDLYPKEKAEALAESVVRCVLLALGDEKSWHEIASRKEIAEEACEDITL